MQSPAQSIRRESGGIGTVVRYTLGGVLFGLIFPLGATVIDILLRGLPFSPASALTVQSTQPLHLIIDSAPLILGGAGWLAGLRQSNTEQLSAELRYESEQRTAEHELSVVRLRTVSDLARLVTRSRQMDIMLEEALDLVVEGFGITYALLFLIDDGGRFAHLRASSSRDRSESAVHDQRRQVGSQSLIGQVTANGEPLLALRTDNDPVLPENEMVPAANSELVIPLRVGSRITGALDLQSDNSRTLSMNDLPVYHMVADQLAVAIDNVGLFQDAQQNLREIEALNRQLTGAAWRDFLTSRPPDEPLGFQSDQRGTRPADASLHSDPATSLPITIRGQEVGSLEVATADDSELDEDVKAILEAVAERVALALDNTRLSQQAQRTVQIQQLITEYADKLQGVTEIKAVLELTASEASDLLGTSRGFVHLGAQTSGARSGGTKPLGFGKVRNE